MVTYSKSYECGFSFKFFGNYIEISVDYFIVKLALPLIFEPAAYKVNVIRCQVITASTLENWSAIELMCTEL